MASRSTPERLARLEESLRAHTAMDETRLSSIDGKLDKMGVSMTAIELNLSKQRGFMGGVVFVVSGVWAAVVALVKFKTGV